MTNTADAYKLGWNHGHGIACHNVPKVNETYWTDAGKLHVDADPATVAETIRDVHISLCHAAADNARSYSPFEFTAKEFNHNEDRADELWDAFETGTWDAILADVSGYTDADYGIVP